MHSWWSYVVENKTQRLNRMVPCGFARSRLPRWFNSSFPFNPWPLSLLYRSSFKQMLWARPAQGINTDTPNLWLYLTSSLVEVSEIEIAPELPFPMSWSGGKCYRDSTYSCFPDPGIRDDMVRCFLLAFKFSHWINHELQIKALLKYSLMCIKICLITMT